jgi:hypothetical protein
LEARVRIEGVLRLVVLVMAGFGLGPLAGCGPSGTGEEPVASSAVHGPLSYARDVERLIGKRCGSCHGADDPDGKLVLDPGVGFGQMVDRPSTQVPELVIVMPGDVDGSYLWQKLEGTSAIGKGMPRTLLGFRKLPERELELLRRWIADGALP